MTATAEISRDHAFVLMSEQIQKLWGLLTSRVGDVTATAHCADDIERSFNTANALAAYENPRDRQIVRLQLRARSADYDKNARITFGGYAPITASIEGPETVVTRFRDDVGDILAGTKAWYSGIAKIDAFYVVMFLCAVSFLFLRLVTPEPQNPSFPGLSFGKAALAIGVLFLILGGLAALVWCLNRIRATFFPLASFALGQGEQRYEFAERVRWGVIVAFGISVAASAFLMLVWPAA